MNKSLYDKASKKINNINTSYNKDLPSNELIKLYKNIKIESLESNKQNQIGINTIDNKSQIDIFNKVDALKFLINIVDKYSYKKMYEEIEEKKNEKKILEDNIENLSNKINDIKIKNKYYNLLFKLNLVKKSKIRNIKIKTTNSKNELFQIKLELATLLNQIQKENKELSDNIINLSEYKKHIYLIKNEIKKYNNIIRQQKADNDNKINGIRLLNNHINLMKEKLRKQNGNTYNFFTALTNLAIKSKQCEYKRKKEEIKSTKRAKSTNKPRSSYYNFNFL